MVDFKSIELKMSVICWGEDWGAIIFLVLKQWTHLNITSNAWFLITSALSLSLFFRLSWLLFLSMEKRVVKKEVAEKFCSFFSFDASRARGTNLDSFHIMQRGIHFSIYLTN